MTVSTTVAADRGAIAGRGRASLVEGWFDQVGVLGYVLMTPALLLLIIFIAYPFALGVWYSMSDVQIFGLGKFIGLKNYADMLNSPVFVQTV
jgi:multiple sugar transport system permease protein